MQRRFEACCLAFLAAAFAAGCGSNTPEIPPELLQNTQGCSAPNYPAAPYGVSEGSTVQNLCFEGWLNPKAANYDPASFRTVAFSDFYNPDGSLSIDGVSPEILLINTAALWCQACQVEHADLPDRLALYKPKGLVILSALFQDRESNPAEPSDLVLWTNNFEVEFPMVLDPDYQMGSYATAETAPLNLVVDARSMKILKLVVGDQAAVIWPLIAAELDKRAAAK